MEHFSNEAGRRRREYSKTFKAQVLAACAEPGASVGGVALSHGLHANMVHRWIREARQVAGLAGACTGHAPSHDLPGFIALPLPQVLVQGDAPQAAALPVQPSPVIHLSLQRGDLRVSLSCPGEQCAALLREVLR